MQWSPIYDWKDFRLPHRYAEEKESLIQKIIFIATTFRSFFLYPTALRKATIVCNFGLSECNRVNVSFISYVNDFVQLCLTLIALAIQSRNKLSSKQIQDSRPTQQYIKTTVLLIITQQLCKYTDTAVVQIYYIATMQIH